MHPYYRKSKYDVADDFKRMRKDRNCAYSSDENDDDEEENKLFEEKSDGELGFKRSTNKDIDDSDNDDDEFEDAKEEEKQDMNVYQSKMESRVILKSKRSMRYRPVSTQLRKFS